jgi:curved DNA-binding protein CbpA
MPPAAAVRLQARGDATAVLADPALRAEFIK